MKLAVMNSNILGKIKAGELLHQRWAKFPNLSPNVVSYIHHFNEVFIFTFKLFNLLFIFIIYIYYLLFIFI